MKQMLKVGLLASLLAIVANANSQDDNLADKMREDLIPQLPTVDNIV